MFVGRRVRVVFDTHGILDHETEEAEGVVTSFQQAETFLPEEPLEDAVQHAATPSGWVVSWDQGWESQVSTTELLSLLVMHNSNRSDPEFNELLTSSQLQALLQAENCAECLASDQQSRRLAQNAMAEQASDDSRENEMSFLSHTDEQSTITLQHESNTVPGFSEPLVTTPMHVTETMECTAPVAGLTDTVGQQPKLSFTEDMNKKLRLWRQMYPRATISQIQNMCRAYGLKHNAREMRDWFNATSTKSKPSKEKRREYESNRMKNMTAEKREARKIKRNMNQCKKRKLSKPSEEQKKKNNLKSKQRYARLKAQRIQEHEKHCATQTEHVRPERTETRED